jgi:hypothetical protein
MKKAPFRVLVKINLLNPSHDVAAKVWKIFGITKTATILADGGGSFIN